MTLPSEAFPNLTPQNHRVTSPASPDYNCIAWALEDVENWWQPGRHWLPADWPGDDAGIGALEQLFVRMGYVACAMDARLEAGSVKVALYG